MKERSRECIKSSPVAFLLQGLLSVLWFWFGDFGETSGVERGWGGCCLPRGRVGVSQKTLPVTSGPLRTVNYAHCRNASTQQPNSLRSWKGNTPHTPGGGTTQEAYGVTYTHFHRKTNKHVLKQSHIPPQSRTCRADTHVYKPVCLSSGIWGGMVCGARGEGAQEFHNKWWFLWYLDPSERNRWNSQLPLWQISKDAWPVCSKELWAWQALQENVSKIGKNNLDGNNSQVIVVWATFYKESRGRAREGKTTWGLECT